METFVALFLITAIATMAVAISSLLVVVVTQRSVIFRPPSEMSEYSLKVYFHRSPEDNVSPLVQNATAACSPFSEMSATQALRYVGNRFDGNSKYGGVYYSKGI